MSDLVQHLPLFAAAYAILVVAAASPGPAVALLLGIGLGQGRRAALLTATGIACGSVVINAATMVGVGLLLAEAAWAMTLLRLLGAGYLLWLAWGAFRKARSGAAVPEAAPQPIRSAGALWSTGFLLQVTNPKAIVFWLAIAAVGATAGGGALTHAAFLAGAFAISFVIHGAWALALSSSPVRVLYGRFRRRIEGALGAFFAFAALKMALARS
ncbi:LysE family translocator [Pseudoroseicyclus sp. CXY001]|uniref:LysE family translocator n=1 Tax=Pseudoroseicyclus sp. CXY001 TaxID=3242492 RepID=UPI003570BA0C